MSTKRRTRVDLRWILGHMSPSKRFFHKSPVWYKQWIGSYLECKSMNFPVHLWLTETSQHNRSYISLQSFFPFQKSQYIHFYILFSNCISVHLHLIKNFWYVCVYCLCSDLFIMYVQCLVDMLWQTNFPNWNQSSKSNLNLDLF